MANFTYRALTAEGESINGDITAASEADAIEKLRQRNLYPIDAKPASGVSRKKTGRRLTQQQHVTAMLRELATLVGAAQPVDRALAMIIETTPQKHLKQSLARTLTAVRGGSALSAALEDEPRFFGPLDVNLIKAGEAAGRLGDALDELATMREKRAQLSRKVNSALIYPTILACTAIGAVILLLVVVIPEFRSLFSGREDAIPNDTKFIFALSDWATSFSTTNLIIILAGGLLLAQLRHVDAFRLALAKALEKLPLLGQYSKLRNSAELARILGSLRAGGVNLPAALELSRDSMRSAGAKLALANALDGVRTGKTLADSLDESHMFDPMAIRLIRAGEQSGELDPMLRKVADIFEEKLETGLLRLVAVIEPVLVLVMGLVAGGIVLSVMSSVVSVNQLTG